MGTTCIAATTRHRSFTTLRITTARHSRHEHWRMAIFVQTKKHPEKRTQDARGQYTMAMIAISSTVQLRRLPCHLCDHSSPRCRKIATETERESKQGQSIPSRPCMEDRGTTDVVDDSLERHHRSIRYRAVRHQDKHPRRNCNELDMPGRAPLAATAAGPALHTLALSNRHCGLVVNGCGAHALLDLAGHGQESLLNVGSALRRCLEEGNAKAIREFLCSPSALLSRVLPGKLQRTFATVYSTTFLSAISDLLPTRSLLTPSVA